MPITTEDINPTRKPVPEVYQRADGLWDWRLIGGNGELVCGTVQGFTRKEDAAAAILRAAELFEYVQHPSMVIRYA